MRASTPPCTTSPGAGSIVISGWLTSVRIPLVTLALRANNTLGPSPRYGHTTRGAIGRYVKVRTIGTAEASPSSGPSGPTPVGMPSAVGASDLVASVPVASNFTVNGTPSTPSTDQRRLDVGST